MLLATAHKAARHLEGSSPQVPLEGPCAPSTRFTFLVQLEYWAICEFQTCLERTLQGCLSFATMPLSKMPMMCCVPYNLQQTLYFPCDRRLSCHVSSLNFCWFAHLPHHLLERLFEALQAKPPAICMERLQSHVIYVYESS